MKVPFVNLKPIAQRLKSSVMEDWEEVLNNTEFVGGPSVAKFETALAKSTESPYALSCANGTDALIIALQALDVGPGDRVAVPNLTFWATYEAIIQRGAIPVLLDCDSEFLQMSLEELKAAHQKYSLRAAFLVHLFGWASPQTQAIRDFCKAESIALIEDGAQAYGVKLGGKGIFSGAEISTLSFYPAKVVGGAMDGGAILCKNEETLKLCKVLANHGRSSHYSYSHAGWNSRMGGLQAKWLLRLLEIEDELLDSRRYALEYFKKNIRVGTHAQWVQAPNGILENAYLAVLRVKASERERIQSAAIAKGVDCKNTYPETLCMQAMAKDDLRVSDLRHSKQFVSEVMNLPLYAFMEKAELEHVTAVMNEVLK
jgi:UDP-2-acetamido-2-deoxy-ribo-hexuluronate aminotransferase